jgi:amino acid adenylation domain-containing protein/non-ribosomal peptide synthase protein (TIGR01720 family)
MTQAQMLLEHVNKLDIRPADNCLQLASIAFDVASAEVGMALVAGASIVILEKNELAHGETLESICDRYRVSHFMCIPHLLEACPIEAVFNTVRCIVVGGTSCPPALVKRFAKNRIFKNAYGPTETTVFASIGDALNPDTEKNGISGLVSIGRPIQNTQIYILDANLNPLPVGLAGELYIAGAGLARGYLGRAGLTAERFVANPFTPGTRMYRSGDLARWTEDGVLEYLGRADAQVKIRGFRIELGEIEAALVSIPGIAQCTVQARGEDGAKQLVAYLVAGTGTAADAPIPETSALRGALASTLPDYMLPAAFVVLESLPLTPNGKLDVRALPAPEITGEGEYRAPVTEHEQLVARLFTELTGAKRVGLGDSFFALGGDSISAIRLVSLARARNAHLTVRSIFEHPSVQALAAAIEVRHEQALILKPEAGAVPLTPIQTQFLQLSGSVTQFNQAFALVAPGGCSVEQVRSMLAKLVAHHDALRLALIDTPSGRSLWLQDEAPALEIVEVDLSAQDADTQTESIAKLGEDLSKRLDPYGGQMLAATWVTTSNNPRARAQLLLAIHHLAVDGVSWRILFEDLEHLRVSSTLPSRTHSVRDWAHALALQATTRESELGDWCETLAGAQALGTDTPIAPELNRMGDARHHVSPLSQELASSLGEVARTYHAGMDEVLIAALGLALTAWQEAHYGLAAAPMLIDLESHGRQSDSVLLEGSTPIDITHTVGWFTSVYPVRLDASVLDLNEALAGGDAAGLMLRATKERIAKMPDKGLGFGILRHLNEKTASVLGALPQAQIVFNYLGRFEQTQPQAGWYSNTFVGSPDDLDRARMHEIDVNAAFDEQGRLQVVWSHHPLQHLPTRIEDLALRFEQALNALVRHATQAPLAQRHTPSDFALARARGLDQAMLDRWPQATEVWPLTALQQGLGFESLALADAAHDPYRVQLRMTLKGPLDSARLKRALEALLERHPILNLTLPTEMLEKGLGIRRPQGVDFTLLSADESALSALILEDLHTPFDLERGPLIRVRLIQTAPDVHHLILTNHHAILDGWSTPIVMGDLAALYRAEVLPPTLAWGEHLKWLAAQDAEAAQRYWRGHLAGQESGALWLTHSKLDQTADEHREQTQTQDPGEYIEHISSDVSAGLERFARNHGLTLANVVQPLYLLLLARLSSRNDITIGVTRSGRSAQRAGIDRAVGLYISTMPLRAQIDLSQPLVEWMRELQTEFAQQDEHLHLGLQNVQQLIGQQTLFDSLFVFENYPIDHSVQRFAPGLEIAQVSGHDATHYGLALAAMMSPSGLVLRTTYDQTLLEAKQIQRIMGRLTQMVQTIATEPAEQLCLGELRWFAQTERHQVVELFNQTEVSAEGLTEAVSKDTLSNEATTLPELFEQQAARTPEATALVFSEATLTYAALNARANQLARHLISLGIGPEQIVAIALPRSIEMVVALLAVLKSGAAYLPLDADYPTARLTFMLGDSGARLLITQTGVIKETIDALQVLGTTPPILELNSASAQATLAKLDQRPIAQAERVSPLTSQNLAYLIYTSGSTGTPKGAGNTQSALINRLDWMQSKLQLTSADRVLQKTPWSFDVSVWEFLLPVLNGATLIVAKPDGHKDPQYLAQCIREQGITTLHFVPSMLDAFLASDIHHGLLPIKHLVTSGEALSGSLQLECLTKLPNTLLWNFYGPTEAAIDVTYWQCKTSQGTESPPIGYPIWNTQIYILDASLNPLPVGVAGELYIAGAGLARGYLGRAGLTAERFVANPFTPGARMYRSGDLARWTEDGVLEYLGRADAQVKNRGFRIEL